MDYIIYERKVKILFEKVKFNLILSIPNKDWLLDNLLINLKNWIRSDLDYLIRSDILKIYVKKLRRYKKVKNIDLGTEKAAKIRIRISFFKHYGPKVKCYKLIILITEIIFTLE